MPTIEELQAAADAFNRPEPRRELTKEDDLARMMRQIEALESQKPLAQADGEPAQSPHSPVPSSEAAALPSSLPASPSPAPPNLPKAPDWLHSIAEVVSKESRRYGALFKLGDIKAGRAHGYIIKERGAREYITVPADHIEIRSPSKVKARECCSPHWMSEHKE